MIYFLTIFLVEENEILTLFAFVIFEKVLGPGPLRSFSELKICLMISNCLKHLGVRNRDTFLLFAEKLHLATSKIVAVTTLVSSQ
jgi:hypothetical protein